MITHFKQNQECSFTWIRGWKYIKRGDTLHEVLMLILIEPLSRSTRPITIVIKFFWPPNPITPKYPQQCTQIGSKLLVEKGAKDMAQKATPMTIPDWTLVPNTHLKAMNQISKRFQKDSKLNHLDSCLFTHPSGFHLAHNFFSSPKPC